MQKMQKLSIKFLHFHFWLIFKIQLRNATGGSS